MTEKQYTTFEEFWPYYLSEHSDPTNRLLHVAGTTGALSLVAASVLLRRPGLLALAPLAGYGPAWVGHFKVERNRPATFTYPLWSLLADFKMNALFWRGKLDDELQRLGITGGGSAGLDETRAA